MKYGHNNPMTSHTYLGWCPITVTFLYIYSPNKQCWYYLLCGWFCIQIL